MRTFTWDAREWRDNWKHLRVPFQLTLAPIFLWGYFLSGAAPAWRLLAAFCAFHFLLYTGITAYNSCCDRDEGPVGGMEHPPLVRPSLLPLSLALQVIGLPVAASYGAAFLIIYLVFVLLGLLYSHPRTRWKASPWLSALVVCGGQGGLGYLAGWAAARGSLHGVESTVGLLGCLSAALTTFAMYPLTQVFQVDEDARRGDRTLCVALGAAGGLRVSEAAFALAGAAAVALALRRLTLADAALLAAAYAWLWWRVGRLRRSIANLAQGATFRLVRALSYGAAAAFTLFIATRLVRW